MSVGSYRFRDEHGACRCGPAVVRQVDVARQDLGQHRRDLYRTSPSRDDDGRRTPPIVDAPAYA